MKLTVLAACASVIMAFADTAAFFSSLQIGAGNLQYITKAADLSAAFRQFSSRFCLESDEKLIVYRVSQLSRTVPEGTSPNATFLKHIHYLSGSEIDLLMDDECSVMYVDEIPSDLSKTPANIVVIEVEDSLKHTIDEFLSTGTNVVVQGKPGFQTAGSRCESIKDFIGNKLNLDFDAHAKRDSENFENLKYSDAFERGVETEFEIAESLIAAQESDEAASALSDGITARDFAGTFKSGTSTNSNLFTNYQFFTPGVWLELIVCFFLVYVCITAVSWIMSIELSYRSFEKQIEYEKKTE